MQVNVGVMTDAGECGSHLRRSQGRSSKRSRGREDCGPSHGSGEEANLEILFF